uniref:Uncharacterized protein n=1 Tax=Coturnix japonica TaxID=93934 RepID=A0A8C2TFL3_COTJA
MGSGSSRRRGRVGGAPRQEEAAAPLPAAEERRAPGTELEAAPPGPAQPQPEVSARVPGVSRRAAGPGRFGPGARGRSAAPPRSSAAAPTPRSAPCSRRIVPVFRTFLWRERRSGSKQPVGCPAILYHGSEEELMASIEREYGC